MIKRKPSSLKRFIEIIRSMPKPQIMFVTQIDPFRNPFGKVQELNIAAANIDGICFYSCSYDIEPEDKQLIEYLNNMPSNIFVHPDKFKLNKYSNKIKETNHNL
jgi:hypothetical protein